MSKFLLSTRSLNSLSLEFVEAFWVGFRKKSSLFSASFHLLWFSKYFFASSFGLGFLRLD